MTPFTSYNSETPSQPSNDNTFPIDIETKQDASINNLTRTDVNCDKTGTCYDGKTHIYIFITTFITSTIFFSLCPLQRHSHRCSSKDKQTIQRQNLRFRTIRNMQHWRH